MPVTFFGLDYLLFLPAAMGVKTDGSFSVQGFYWATTRMHAVNHASGGYKSNMGWMQLNKASIRLASVVSEVLTHAGKCQKMLFVIMI